MKKLFLLLLITFLSNNITKVSHPQKVSLK